MSEKGPIFFNCVTLGLILRLKDPVITLYQIIKRAYAVDVSCLGAVLASRLRWHIATMCHNCIC
jgi:hypothetical protein